MFLSHGMWAMMPRRASRLRWVVNGQLQWLTRRLMRGATLMGDGALTRWRRLSLSRVLPSDKQMHVLQTRYGPDGSCYSIRSHTNVATAV
jgi:hypothetical protein